MIFLFYFLFSLSALTASFDLVGAFDLFGGNLRATNLMMLAFNFFGMISAIKYGFPRVYAFVWLAIWTLADAVCVVNAPQIFRTYAYLVWLLVDLAFIFATATVFRGPEHALRIAKINYWIYGVIAGFGLLQFVLFVGGQNLLVQQTWTASIPRINGLSYEPSYYSTYLIVGWAVSLYLLLYPNNFMKRSLVWVMFGLHTAALILCTSRLGFFGMALMFVFMLPRIFRLLLLSGTKGLILLVILVAGLGAISVTSLRALKGTDLSIFLEGTGVGGTAAHSVDARMSDFAKYRDLLVSNPVKGYSLGGIAGVIASGEKGQKIDYEELRKSQGINVSLEIVLAAGVLAAPLFFIYLYKMTVGVIRRAFFDADEDLIIITKANAWGLLVQFALLQFNQNILRNYFWIQLAIVSCLATELFRQKRIISQARTENAESAFPVPSAQ